MTDTGALSPTDRGRGESNPPDQRPGAEAVLRPMDLGWLAAGLALASALGLTVLRARSESDPGPGMTPLAMLGFFAFWAGPGIVGLIGTVNRRREVLVGSGVACLPMAVLSFSGVTLVLLAPAILFLYAGLRDVGGRDRPAGGRRDRPLVSAAIAVLLIGGIASLFLGETICWERHADGSVRLRPDLVGSMGDGSGSGEASVGVGDVVASGCSSGEISPTGSAIAVACVVAAAGLAIRVGRPSA